MDGFPFDKPNAPCRAMQACSRDTEAGRGNPIDVGADGKGCADVGEESYPL